MTIVLTLGKALTSTLLLAASIVSAPIATVPGDSEDRIDAEIMGAVDSLQRGDDCAALSKWRHSFPTDTATMIPAGDRPLNGPSRSALTAFLELASQGLAIERPDPAEGPDRQLRSSLMLARNAEYAKARAAIPAPYTGWTAYYAALLDDLMRDRKRYETDLTLSVIATKQDRYPRPAIMYARLAAIRLLAIHRSCPRNTSSRH